ncbi:MAG TPA: hypothetical protein DCP32_02205 [Anaerolineaceae bacterium]|nr:MAG: hypothetical protein A2X24_00255 [Chloroflexi bacterium GWB2_54_36]HAL15591.1 hypothetical protein [Anaerolineaceae bacterium]HBA91505.1 hypothetical protein [Anaerolineaceae bacterium]
MSLDNTPPNENEPDENQSEGLSFDEFRDQYDDEVPTEEEPPQPGGRTFVTVVGIIGAIVVLAALALVGYFLFTRGTLATRFQQQAAQVNAENTAIAATATDASMVQMTQKAILPPTWTPLPQNTTVQASPTPKPTNTADAAAENSTATAQANLTLSAQGGSAGTPVAQAASPTARATARASATSRVSATPLKTATALPQTGFADEVGLPGLLGLALSLVIVVFAARRIRLSASH